MQKILPLLTLLAALGATAARADVPVPGQVSLRLAAENRAPLAERFIPQPIVRPGRGSLSSLRESGLRTVSPASQSRLPKK
jgi:hypothetical protein